MSVKHAFNSLAKLLLGGLAFSLGVVLGGMVATMLRLQPPTLAGIDMTLAAQYMFLESPLLAFALALIARGLAGRFVPRALTLAFLTWIAYTVNTQLEAAIFTDLAGGFWFTVISFAVPSVACGAMVAWLFPGPEAGLSVGSTWKPHFRQRAGRDWAWRLAVAAIAFMPIYWVFGLLVVPFTGAYYQQNMFGLRLPGLDQILTTLLTRSVLFLLACLPVLVAWRRSRLSLFLSLGSALFVLVGLLYMLGSYWLPVSVRLPHTLEILADSFVYAGALVLLLVPRQAASHREQRVVEPAALSAQ